MAVVILWSRDIKNTSHPVVMEMDAQDRRLLSETHGQSMATAKVVETFIDWSKEVHRKRDEEMRIMYDRIEDHHFYIRILKWVITPLTPIGVMGAILAAVQWAFAHAK
jgi:hypothetical protein